MQTLRQFQRLWNTGQHDRLAREILRARPEATPRVIVELSRALPAAALVLIRLDELGQGYHSFNASLIRYIIAAQEGDGGWGDPLTTALCLRALLLGQGHGLAVDRAVQYLADLQKTCGVWPGVSIRRMPEDPFVSAWILYCLGDQPTFASAVRMDDAEHYFTMHAWELDLETRRLWERAQVRCRISRLVLSN